MSSDWIPDGLLEVVSVSFLGARYALEDIGRDAGDPARGAFDAALSAVPADDLEEWLTCPERAWLARSADGRLDEGRARLEVLIAAVGDRLYARRTAALCQPGGRPPPYHHPALSDVVPDDDGLVPLNTFKASPGGLRRGGFVFNLAVPLRAENSGYPYRQALIGLRSACHIHVRPDPLMVAPEQGHRSMEQRMLVFGRGLDWDRLAVLEREETARWLPDESTSSDCAFTDLVWCRRGAEVHFECEEVPRRADQRPARYFHAIYSPAAAVFRHADAAVRFYTPSELAVRDRQHLKDLGKVGRRVKLFRLDGDLDRADWTTVLASAFVWNNDIRRYVCMERDFDAEWSSVHSRPT